MAWYQVKGNETDVVISSRVRLARNLQGYPFEERLTAEAATEIIEKIEKALGADFKRTDMADVTPLMAESMVEKHFISRDFAKTKSPHALFTNENRSLYLMALEEDHVRLQCILPGLALRDAYQFAVEADERLDAALPLAFDEQLGYLTHCPTNLGTGLRASVMLFLPALTERGYMPSLTHQLTKLGLTIRGLYGEGSGTRGSLYQISNQVTLGLSEEDILTKLEETVNTIIEKERKARVLSGEAAAIREDRIHRAEGVLRYATRISSAEFFTLFESLKLGVALGLIDSIKAETLHTLLFHVLPATLTLSEGGAPEDGAARDAARAAYIKRVLEDKKL
ncbi:MAG: ATP--guanido phosphotransferase [Clostridia bacterium]|nr:ATP--guanido phosphotransferase [Clostridia bacterium]